MHDYVILGGGSSGCVLAARLSEDERNGVLLIEAGKDVTAETAPADVLASYPGRAYFNPDFTWPGLNVLLGGASQNDPGSRKSARYEQARILGGGSSINGLIAVRGAGIRSIITISRAGRKAAIHHRTSTRPTISAITPTSPTRTSIR